MDRRAAAWKGPTLGIRAAGRLAIDIEHEL